MESIKTLFELPLQDPVLIFSIVLGIILFSPIIFNKIHIPHIVGLILAGVGLGPHGVGLLDYDSSFKLFGQVGVLYIMFLAGVDMDMDDFRRNRGKSLQDKQKAEQKEQAKAEPEKKKSNRLGYMEKRELAALPEKIEALETDLAALKAELDDPQLFATQPAVAVQKTQQMAELEQQLEQLVERWAELAERE